MDLLKDCTTGTQLILMSRPFNLKTNFAGNVVCVLKFGSAKHSDTDHDAITHLDHAIAHLKADGKDPETGYTDKAHAVARCMLAIERIGRDYA